MDRRRFLGFIGSLSVLSPAAAFASQRLGAARVGAYRMQDAGQSSRLLLDLYGDVSYQVFTLSNPSRIVIDFKGVPGHLPLQHLDLSNTPLTSIRSGPRGSGLRLVLTTREPITPHVSLQPGHSLAPRQLAIDLPHAPMLASARQAAPVQPHQEPARLVHQGGRRAAVIAIDPGHGGKDPGAVSATSHYEKYVALNIATKLHNLLDKDPAFHPTLTRDDDHFIPLFERVTIAHQHKADMFVSVHADAAPNRSANGASVYALSQHGATSAMARFMAQSENDADKYMLAGSTLRNADPSISKLLVDMSMSATIDTSLGLGEIILNNMGQVTRIHQQRVDQAGFAVLKSPDIPSILVENGFMSNPDDCRRLITDHHQQALAESLYASIRSFYQHNPMQLGPA